MSCIVTNFTIVNDSKDKIKKAIIAATLDENLRYLLASDYNNGYFAKWYDANVENKPADDNGNPIAFNNQHANTVKSVIKNYMIEKYPAIEHTSTANQDIKKGLFKTIGAKTTALKYSGYHIGLFFNDYFNLPTEEQAKQSVRDYVYNKLFDYVDGEFISYINRYFEENQNSSAYNEYKKNKDIYDEYRQTLADKKKELLQLKYAKENQQLDLNYFKDKTYNEALTQVKEERQKAVVARENIKKIAIDEFKENYENEKYYNYAALYRELEAYHNSGEVTEFIQSLDAHQSLFSLARQLKNSSENEKSLNNPEEDEYGGEDELSEEDRDVIAADFDNYVYKTYLNLFDSEVRDYISHLLKLNVPYNTYKQAPSYDTDNELGVAMPINERKVITQIVNFSNFYSLQNFIATLKELANKNRDLYSISPLIDKMEEDKVFARKVFTNFAKPVVNKAVVSVNRFGSINFVQSNEQVNAVSQLYFDLLNNLKLTYNLEYNDDDVDELLTNNGARTGYARRIIHSFFPNLSTNVIDDVLLDLFEKDASNNNTKKLENVVKVLQEILKNIQKIMTEKSKVDTQYKEDIIAYESYKSALKDWEEAGAMGPKPKKVDAPVYNSSGISFDGFTPALVELAEMFVPYVSINTELNNVTPTGTKSSNLIKNSAITNFFKQLQMVVNGDENAGTKVLLKYFTKARALEDNPLLFGIKNSDGKVLYEGIFRKDKNGQPHVNPNAKNIINYSLFEGIANRSELEGVEYRNMNQQDYIISSILAYNSPVDFNHQIGNKNVVNKLCNILMRIPSDASNQFAVQIQKHNYYGDNGLFKDDTVNRNSSIFLALRQNIIGEIKGFGRALRTITNYDVNTNTFTIKKSTDGLADFYHIKNGKILDNDNNLVGNAFKIFKLFNIGEYNASKEVASLLYGGITIVKKDGTIDFDAIKNTFFYNQITDSIDMSSNFNYEALDNIIETWIKQYDAYIKDQFDNQYASIFDKVNNDLLNKNIAVEAIFNQTLAYMSFDDIFEGNAKYYKDAQTFLKRAKEVQMSGSSIFAYDFTLPMNEGIFNLQDSQGKNVEVTYKDSNGDRQGIMINGEPLLLTNGFAALTINNTKRGSTSAQKIFDETYQNIIDKFSSDDKISKEVIETMANNIAMSIAKGFGDFKLKNGKTIIGDKTKINDAQSYITIQEFIKRRYANGTLDEYGDLIEQLMNSNVDVAKIDTAKLNKFIQVEKNVYYDLQYDDAIKDYRPRQIKNAEFVLIPALLPEGSDLRNLYDIMIRNNIQQINTLETSKASNKTVLDYWDKSDETKINENFEKEIQSKGASVVENYYYRNLHKQQDMVDHMEDKTNKAGIQILKKILDNSTDETKSYGDKLQEALTANIKDSFNKLLFSFGWKKNKNGEIVNIKNDSKVLDFSEFYSRAREEAQRLGMDSNFIEYLTPNDAGNVDMPNYLGTVAKKIESIAQSIFTNKIARQTLPGWHAVQASAVGYDNDLQYHPNKYINKTDYNDIISIEDYEQLNDDDKNKYIKTEFIECALPVWDSKIEKVIKHKVENGLTRKAAEDQVLEELNKQLLSMQIGYRIPTEGKQSIAIFKIKSFAPRVYGSTIFVSGDWVAQTGSDMDYDTIYGIVHHFSVDEDFNIVKLSPDLDTTEEINIKRRYCRYINEFIEDKRVQEKDYVRQAKFSKQELYSEMDEVEKKKDKFDIYFDGIKKIAKSAGLITYKEFKELSVIEQQTRQVRDNIILDNMIAIMNNSDSLEEVYSRSNFDDIRENKDRLDELSKNTFNSASTYNPFDQFKFMQNAIDGRKLKAFSVNRDTFNSVNNRLHTYLNGNHAIVVKYDLSLKDKDGNALYDKNIIESAFGKENCITEGNIITVTHRQLGWSNNNRNVVGKILTAYSSQTTAHILDAIKEGAIFNETDYTFGTFKTLIDVGIDYRTAISFLMQPTITNLNFHYESANSVYKKEYNNPIQAVLFDIAKQIKPDIEKGITEKELVNIILNDENLSNEFNRVWGVKLDKNIFNTDIALNNFIFEQRFKEENLAVDLGVLILFNKINKTTKNIEILARCANPDSFGAKQTIHSTRKIINNILAYNYYGNNVGKTLTIGSYDSLYNFIEPSDEAKNENYTTFLEKLYPDFGKMHGGNISYTVNIKESGYPSLAAIFNYCTLASVQLNQQIFDFESDQINDFILSVEDKLGRNFTDKEYDAFKKFMLSNIYKNVSVLGKPITINSHKQLALDEEKIDKDNYWITEENRIFGYVETMSNVSIEHLYNPTLEELRNYSKLTPLQKVMFIKKNFSYNAGIFDYIKCSKVNRNELQTQGYSKNRLNISFDGLDAEELFILFNQAFFNSNPLIKLAALDLIKYAFLVEGFNFARNGTSRMITNKSLFADLSAGGTNIIQEIKDSVNDIKNDELLKDFKDKVARNFVRSHNFVATTRRFSKDSEINNKFRNLVSIKERGYVEIDAANNKDLIEYLKLSGNREVGYINIGYYGAGEYKKYYENLYEMHLAIDDDRNITKAYLIPLNLLEPTEYRDYSLNNDNNKHFSYEYYMSEILNKEDVIYDEGLKIIPTYKFLRLSKTNPNQLMEMLNNNLYTDYLKQKIKNVYDEIVEHFSDYTALSTPLVFDSNLTQIKSLFDGNSVAVRQNIILKDGTERTVVIKRRSAAINDMRAYHNGNKRKVAEYIKEQEENIDWNDKTDQKINLYSATLLPLESNINIDDYKDSNDAEDEVLSSRIRYSSTVPSMGGKVTSYENVANLIAKDIEYKAHHNDAAADNILHEFINKGISINTLMDISARTNDIYVLSSKYYNYVSNVLSDKLHSYTIDGIEYSLNPYETIDGKSLYDALREHPEERDKFFRMIIEAKTFGDAIKDLLRLPVEGREPLVDKAINSIKKDIERVRNNNNLKLAFDAIFDYYIAKEYSENPNIRYNYVKLTDIYNDINWWDTQLSDVAELDHKQIQVIVKMANEIIAKGHFDGLDKVKEFKEHLSKLLKEDGSFDWNNIITELGKFVRILNDKFFEDKKAIFQKVRDAIDKYGYNSFEYLKAKFERDEWLYKHTYQELKDDYYKEDLENRRRILEKAPQDYVKYLQLKEKIYSNYIPYSMMNAEQKAERNRIWEQINKLRGKTIDLNDTHIDLNSLFENSTNYLEEFIIANRNLKNKYFHTVANEDFVETLKIHLDFIDSYDAKHPDKTLNQKLNDSEDYKLSYDWVKENTIRKLNQEAANKINAAFAALNKVNDRTNKALKTAIDKVPTDERYDAYGIINGNKYTTEQQERIKELTLKKFYPYGEFKEDGLHPNTLNENFDSKYSDNGLLKEIDDRLGYITFNDLFYKEAFNEGKSFTAEDLKNRYTIYSKINSITAHGFEDGRFSIKSLYEYYKSINNLKALTDLGDLYQQLRNLNKIKGKFKEKEDKFKIQRNTIAFDRNLNEINSRNSKILNILCDRDKDGNYLTDKNGNKLANRFLFGYYAPINEDGSFDPDYIDEPKTNAKKVIYDYISYEETEHLAEALKEAQRNGTLEEFKARNQVYNPYAHRYEWTSIWTTMTVSPDITDGVLYTYEPQERYSRREINNGVDYDHNLIGAVEDARNEKYQRGEINWRKEDKTYVNDNYKKLSKKEQDVVEYLQKIVNNYATAYSHKQFAMQGYIPRMPTIKTDAKWYAKEVASTLGFSARNYNDREWHDIIDFTHDFDAKFNIFDLIKGKGSKELIKIKPKTFETDEQYTAYVNDVKKQNEEIKKENLRIDNELLNRNYESVFEQLIYNGEDYAARNNCKDLIYLMIEDLKSRKAIKVNNFGKLSRNRKVSSEDNEVYNTTDQSNALLIFQNWARRILFAEYKQLSPATRYADALQNLTTVKFMMLNVLGGIANIGTGLVNILGEGFANDFFSAKEFNAQSVIYSKKALKMISAFFTDKVDDKYVAITKYFDIVDYDAMLYLAKQNSSIETSKKINELLYSFLSGGEHYMQNTALFALLESHRLYKNKKGEYEAININEYKADIDVEAFENTLTQKYPSLVDSYKLFVSSAISDKNIQRSYDRFKSTPINDFIRSISDKTLRTELVNEYDKNKKAYNKVAEEEFNKLPTVMSELEFVDGELKFVKHEDIDKDALIKNIKGKVDDYVNTKHGTYNKSEQGIPILSNSIMAHLKFKAQEVNKKIHGVYDKIGGARIEQYWWGNLVTQYHKHLYPGIMKRYRMNGFFNEGRGAIDFGSYVSAFKLAANSIKDIANDSKRYKTENLDGLAEDNEIDAIKSIGAFMTNVIHLANYFNFEWKLLPSWEKKNIYRCLGDACGVGAGLLASFAIYLAVDDDDLKDNNFINSCLYLSDRLITESNMYTPMGLYSESSTLWRSPVAGLNTIKDLFKCIELTNRYILDPSFSITYENGMYKGQNKYKVIIERNIPIYRMYKRYDNMAKNNNYYRINESTIDRRLMKTIAEEITEED